MGNCKFYKQQKQVSYDNGTIWTNVTPSEFQKGELYEPNSQDCSTTIYRWVESGDTYCGEYALSKQLYIKQISIDSGITWNNVVPLETEERDIAYACTAYRWVNLDPSTDYYCEGTAKYYKQQKQVSYDGVTWTDVAPSEFQKGELYKPNSLDCGYIPSIDSLKLIIIEKNSDSAFETPCDSTSAITRSDVFSMTRSNILSVKIGDCVTSIGEGTFSGCTSLSSVTIGSGVTTIGKEAFYGCTSLSSITIPNSVTSIGSGAFRDCTSLSSVTIPSGVTNIGGSAFSNCKSLTSVTIPDSVTSIGYSVFSLCTSLPSITIPYGITSIGNEAFYNCTSLSSVTIPDSVTSIGNKAFYGCSSLSSVTIPDSVTSIGGYAFYGCSNLSSVTIGTGITSISEFAFTFNGGSILSFTCLASTPPTLAKAAISAQHIYVHCESLMAYKLAWSNYSSIIEAIESPCGPTPTGATKIQSTYSNGDVYFKYCDSSTELTSGDTKPSGYNCTAMTSCLIGDCVTSIGYNAFSGCTSLSSVTIPSSITSIGGFAFNLCTSLSSVTIPSGVTTIGLYAFQNCSGLISIDIPNSVTSLGNGVFYRCSGLTSCTIGSSVTYIGNEAFSGCKSLSSITIPNSVTSIGTFAFSGCSSLSSVTIGSGVTSISGYAFYTCSSLQNITVLAPTPPTLETNAFTNTNNCPIYVPAASVDAYKSSWSSYASRIQPIT